MGVTIFERSNKGVVVTEEGETFLGYARQVLEQVDLLEERYCGEARQVPHFSVSCQHYSFAVNAFVDVIRQFDAARYDFTLREEQTHEIIEDVSHMKSELGILYLSSRNREVIEKMLRQNELEFAPLFRAEPHVFLSSSHPLAGRSSVTLDDLQDYPYLSYEQGDYNSFYFSEEILSTLDRAKNIRVRDRATLFNLVIGLDGYTVCSGVISAEAGRRGYCRCAARCGRVYGDRRYHAKELTAHALWRGVCRGAAASHLDGVGRDRKRGRRRGELRRPLPHGEGAMLGTFRAYAPLCATSAYGSPRHPRR